jgi:hypothetical protein
MAITVPVPGDIVDANTFGIPVANQLNALAVTAWTTLVLNTNWTLVGGATPQYRKVGDNIQVRGIVANAAGGQGVIIATLPAGFRPLQNLYPISGTFYGASWALATIYIEASSGFMIYHANSPANPNYLGLGFMFSAIA